MLCFVGGWLVSSVSISCVVCLLILVCGVCMVFSGGSICVLFLRLLKLVMVICCGIGMFRCSVVSSVFWVRLLL